MEYKFKQFVEYILHILDTQVPVEYLLSEVAIFVI